MNKIDRKSGIPVYLQAKWQLEQQMIDEELVIGQKLPSERKLCEEIGISRLMCRRAMRDLVDEGVLDVVENVGYYVKNLQPLIDKKIQEQKGLIGLIVPNFRNRYYTNFFQGIYNAFKGSHYNIVLGDSDEDYSREKAEIMNFVRKGIDGLILFPYRDALTGDYFEELRGWNVPVILSHCTEYEMVDSVNIDNENGARSATGHLIESGHRNIAFLSCETEEQGHYVGERICGFRSALESAGIAVDPSAIVTGFQSGDQDGLGKILKLLLKTGVTAVMCCTDREGFDLCDAASKDMIAIPDDLSVIGFNNYLFLERPKIYSFTTMGIEYRHMGELIGNRLLETLRGEKKQCRHEKVAANLIERGSVKKLG